MLKISSASLLEIRWRSSQFLEVRTRSPRLQIRTLSARKFQIFLPNKARERECFRMTGLERPSLSWDGRALDAHKMGCGCWGGWGGWVGGGGFAEEMSDLSRFPSPLPPLPLSSSSSDIRRPCSTSVLRLASFLCNIGLIFHIGLIFILASFLCHISLIFHIGLVFLFIWVVSSLLFSETRSWLWTNVPSTFYTSKTAIK